MKTFTIITILSFLSFGLTAQKYTKSSNTSIGFKIKNAGFNVKGKFKTVMINSVFDASNPSKSKLKGVADAKTVSTGIGLRDRHLKSKPEFFGNNKSVTMESYKIIKVSDAKYTVFWKLSMRGITKNIKTTMNVKKLSDGVSLSSSFKINRNTWDLGGSSITMGDIVTVNISTTLK